MFPIPPDFQANQSLRNQVLSSPIAWVLCLITILHLISFIPAHLSQKTYHQRSEEFKVLWNTGGSMALAAQGIEPSKKEEATRRESYLRTYVDQSVFYNVWIVPQWVSGLGFLTAWIFQPGWASLFVSVWILLFVGVWLEKTWNSAMPVMLLAGYSIASGFLYYVFVSGILERHLELPFCGISSAAGAALGILIRRYPDQIPMVLFWKGFPRTSIHPYALAGLWLLLDFIVQVFVNPINYGWVFALDLASVAIGYALCLYIPAPIHAKATARTAFDTLQPIRKHLQEGSRLSDLLELEGALHEFDQALRMLLRSSQPNQDLLEQLMERILNTKHPLPINSQRWYEWGVRLSETEFPRFAIPCLENAAKAPGATSDLARPAIVQAAELRIALRMRPQESKPLLEKVVKSRSDDPIGRRAGQILDTLPV